MKFKVGDRVRAIAEYKNNKKIIGQVGTVRKIYTDCYYRWGVEFDNDIGGYTYNGQGKPGHFWVIPESKLEKVSANKIIITTDGKTTTARYYNGKRLIQSAETKCSPEDTFDFMTGAKIAFGRLTWETCKKTTAIDEINIGDKVILVDDWGTFDTYVSWIEKNAPEYAVYYAYKDHKKTNGLIGKVVAKAPYDNTIGWMLYLIEADNHVCYLMQQECIRKLEE